MGSQVARYSLAHVAAGEYRKLWRGLLNKPKSLLCGYPRHVLVEPTLRCNLRCALCPSPEVLNPRRLRYETMSFDDFRRVVDHCKDVVYRMYLTFSGEPLLNRELGRMVRYLTESGIVSMISTNATLLTSARAQELMESGLDYLIISFDGFSKESFETFRCGANFEKTMTNVNGIARLKNEMGYRKPYIDIQWIANRLNEKEIERGREYFMSLRGVDEFHVKSLSLNEHIYPRAEVEDLGKRFLPTRGKIRSQYLGREGKTAQEPCTAVYSPVILANGDITVCCIDFRGEHVVGNVVTHKLSEIWKSKEYRELRRRARRFELPLCSRCPIRFNA